METLKITREQNFIESINKWCVAISCNDGGYEVWTGGCFHKKLEKAEEEAMKIFKKSISFQKEIKKCNSPEKTEMVISI